MKRMFISVLLFICFLNSGAWAESSSTNPSFDCTKVKTSAEKMICGNTELFEADAKLSLAYKNALKTSKDKYIIRKDQMNWMKTVRDTCSDTSSMLKAYKTRIIALQGMNHEVFTMEDDDMVPLNQSAVSSIRKFEAKTKGGHGDCENFQGKRVNLDGTGNNEYWIAITADVCGWGTHSARIWVLKHIENGYKVILVAGGYTLKIFVKKSHGLRNILVSAAAAGYYAETGHKYNGKKYVTVHERYVDFFFDPSACSGGRNKDVCP
jgi:uncharacterized protein